MAEAMHCFLKAVKNVDERRLRIMQLLMVYSFDSFRQTSKNIYRTIVSLSRT